MKNIIAFLILFAFWIALTFSLSPENIITGAAAALVTVILFGRYFITDVRKLFQLSRYFWFIIYFFIFLWACIRANFDVAYRVIHPAMPIKPGIVKIEISLKSDIAKTILANSITMTPGTISVDLVDNILYVHWIYVSSLDPEVYRNEIAGRFEKYIKKIFD